MTNLKVVLQNETRINAGTWEVGGGKCLHRRSRIGEVFSLDMLVRNSMVEFLY